MGTTRFGFLYRIIAVLVLINFLIFGQVGRASAGTTRYVKAGATGSHNGTSWANAFTSLQQALNVAVSGDQIWVAKGTYKPTLATDPTDPHSKTFMLKDGVRLYGGFAGKETRASQRNWKTNVTILSGDLGILNDASDNAYHVVLALNLSASAVLDGFTITGGNASGTPPDYWGGGLRNVTGNPTLRNLVFTANQALYAGGGMLNDSGAPTLFRVVFSGNKARYGGGMYSEKGNAVLNDVTFNGNTADGDPLSNAGGGLAVDSSAPTLTNVTFSNNVANGSGGGLYDAANGSPILTNVTFQGNSASGSGGAIYNNASSPKLTHATFGANTAGASSLGGHMYNESNSRPTIHNSIFAATGDIAGDGTSAASISDSIVQGGCPSGQTCNNVINADPKLGLLKNNGGFTKTMGLGAGSAAIDTANALNCPLLDQRGVHRSQGAGCDMGAYEVRVMAFASQAAYDGQVLESSAGSNKGGTANSGATTLRVGDDASSRRFRGILSFNTAPLPDAASIIVARLLLKAQGVVGDPAGSGGDLVTDLADPYFGGQLVLQTVDWQWTSSVASTAISPSFTPAFGPAGGSWYSGTLNKAWRDHIDKKDTTQFRLRLPVENKNGTADYYAFYSGNVPAADRPRLWVYYNP